MTTVTLRHLRDMLRSIRFRLTLWYTAVVGALVVAFAVGSYYVIAQVLARRAEQFFSDAHASFYEEIRKEVGQGDEAAVVIRNAMVDYRFREIEFVAFADSTLVARSPIARTSGVPSQEEPFVLNLQRLREELERRLPDARFTLDDPEGGYRIAVRHLSIGNVSYRIVAAQSLHGYAETLQLIAWGYLLIVPLLVLCAAGGGYWLAAYSLAPVSAMGAKVVTIGRQNMHERLTVINPDDELGRLAAVFNDLLSRLGAAFDQQQRFMQDASHELRTPVSIIRAEADVALAQPIRSEAEYRTALGVVQDSSARLSRIVEDLFLLARADAHQAIIDTAPLDLGEVVQSAVRALRHRATGAHVHLSARASPECPFTGDFAQLERVIFNLLENSIRHTPAGGSVLVQLETRSGWYRIRVADSGSGIPLEAQPLVFDRFFRLSRSVASVDQSRVTGSGLGLPIARAIAELHGGQLQLQRSDTSGSEFVVSLPIPSSVTSRCPPDR